MSTEAKTSRSWAERLGRVVDAAVFAISPDAGNRRINARNAREVADRFHNRRVRRLSAMDDDDESDRGMGGGGFRSAAHERNDGTWLTSGLSPDAALDLDLPKMRMRSNAAYKNYEIIASHVERKVRRVAGAGIMVAPQIKPVDGKISKEQSEVWNPILRDTYERWARKAGGRRVPIHMILRMVARHIEKDGAAYVQFGDVKQRDARLPITLRVKVIHPRRVETPPEFAGDPLVRGGIRFDEDGDEIGYYVRTAHPGDNKKFEYKHEYVEAYADNGLARMVHIFEQREADQSEGYPQLQVSLRRCKNAEEYEEAEIERNIIASCHVGVQTSALSGEDAALGAAHGTDSRGRLLQDMSPGRMDYQIEGDDIKFNTPPGPQGTYAPFVEHQNRMASAGLGTSYEMATGDWRGLTYSGGKLIWNDEQPAIDCFQLDLIELLLIPLHENFINRCVTQGVIEVSQAHYREAPHEYERCKFIPPKRIPLDPARERRAAHADIEAGITLHSDEVEQMNGRPADDVYADYQSNFEKRKKFGVPLHMPQLGGTQPGDDNPATEEGSPGREKREAVGAE